MTSLLSIAVYVGAALACALLVAFIVIEVVYTMGRIRQRRGERLMLYTLVACMFMLCATGVLIYLQTTRYKP